MLLEAIVFIGLDDTSNRALENLREASEALVRDYGVKLVIVPVNMWLDPINSSIKSLPMIVINGFKAFSGYAPTPSEIEEYVLKIIRLKNRREELQLPAGTIHSEILTASALAT
ncbi:MAG: hypothetical protein N3D82_03430 [Ignisphaera sp.]|nr:hypothetical protein [Ignisphaera sp.]MCX8168061.1 hypothetical protein [Ignisphaera sp.]MDW8085750.1 hypothetical protein [Ignisphaera sp.]